MHNCRRIESQMVDLLFDDLDREQRLRLLSEIETCANCMGQYLSCSETLSVCDRTALAATPPESYWPRYNATLRHSLRRAPLPAPAATARVPFWRRLLTARLPLPVPIAAALVVAFIISSALALRRPPVVQHLAPSQPPVETVRIVEVPVVREKIVTGTVYVEKKRGAERAESAPLPAVASATELNNSTVANSKHEDEAGFFTRADLKGFQPADEMKIRVIKRNNDR